MNGFTDTADNRTTSALACPTEDDARIALDAAKFRFQRVLGAWASDCLELRRTGQTALVWDRAIARTRACAHASTLGTTAMSWEGSAHDGPDVGTTGVYRAAA